MRWFLIAIAFLKSVFPLGAAEPSMERMVIFTSLGRIVIQPDPAAAPRTVKAIRKYISDQVYENATFDQAGDEYIQGGKPGPEAPKRFSTSGNFDSAKAPAPELAIKHVRGVVGLSRTVGSCNPGKTSNSTQFYICLKDNPKCDGEFSAFGRVVEGIEVADRIGALVREKKSPVPISVGLDPSKN